MAQMLSPTSCENPQRLEPPDGQTSQEQASSAAYNSALLKFDNLHIAKTPYSQATALASRPGLGESFPRPSALLLSNQGFQVKEDLTAADIDGSEASFRRYNAEKKAGKKQHACREDRAYQAASSEERCSSDEDLNFLTELLVTGAKKQPHPGPLPSTYSSVRFCQNNPASDSSDFSFDVPNEYSVRPAFKQGGRTAGQLPKHTAALLARRVSKCPNPSTSLPGCPPNTESSPPPQNATAQKSGALDAEKQNNRPQHPSVSMSGSAMADVSQFSHTSSKSGPFQEWNTELHAKGKVRSAPSIPKMEDALAAEGNPQNPLPIKEPADALFDNWDTPEARLEPKSAAEGPTTRKGVDALPPEWNSGVQAGKLRSSKRFVDDFFDDWNSSRAGSTSKQAALAPFKGTSAEGALSVEWTSTTGLPRKNSQSEGFSQDWNEPDSPKQAASSPPPPQQVQKSPDGWPQLPDKAKQEDSDGSWGDWNQPDPVTTAVRHHPKPPRARVYPQLPKLYEFLPSAGQPGPQLEIEEEEEPAQEFSNIPPPPLPADEFELPIMLPPRAARNAPRAPANVNGRQAEPTPKEVELSEDEDTDEPSELSSSKVQLPFQPFKIFTCHPCSFETDSSVKFCKHKEAAHGEEVAMRRIECWACGIFCHDLHTFRNHLEGHSHAKHEAGALQMRRLTLMTTSIDPKSSRFIVVEKLREDKKIERSMPWKDAEPVGKELYMPASLRRALRGQDAPCGYLSDRSQAFSKPTAIRRTREQVTPEKGPIPEQPMRKRKAVQANPHIEDVVDPPTWAPSVPRQQFTAPTIPALTNAGVERGRERTAALDLAAHEAGKRAAPTRLAGPIKLNVLPNKPPVFVSASEEDSWDASTVKTDQPPPFAAVARGADPGPVPGLARSAYPAAVSLQPPKESFKQPSGAGQTLPAELLHMFVCPLSKKIMRDPVILSDSYTYERSAITEYMKQSDKSPMTGETIPQPPQLLPNRMLLQFADSFGLVLESGVS